MSDHARATEPKLKRGRSGWQTGVILEIEPQTPRISSIHLAPDQPFSFVPGQYLSLRINQRGSTEARKYSIASAPESGATIELAIEALPGGEVSGYFHRSAAPGDTVELRGPRGDFTWSVADGGPVLLVAGGSGLAPLMSMIRHRALRQATIPMGLVYSAASWSDVLFRDELLELAEAKTGFELMLTLTREPAADRPDVGARRIDAAMVADMLKRLPGAVRHAYLCGSDPFVAHAQALVKQGGVAPNRVQTESYGI